MNTRGVLKAVHLCLLLLNHYIMSITDLIVIESEWSNCYGRIPTRFPSNNDFQLFLNVVLNFMLKQNRGD